MDHVCFWTTVVSSSVPNSPRFWWEMQASHCCKYIHEQQQQWCIPAPLDRSISHVCVHPYVHKFTFVCSREERSIVIHHEEVSNKHTGRRSNMRSRTDRKQSTAVRFVLSFAHHVYRLPRAPANQKPALNSVRGEKSRTGGSKIGKNGGDGTHKRTFFYRRNPSSTRGPRRILTVTRAPCK